MNENINTFQILLDEYHHNKKTNTIHIWITKYSYLMELDAQTFLNVEETEPVHLIHQAQEDNAINTINNDLTMLNRSTIIL